MKKVGEFESIKLKKYTDQRLKKRRCDVLDPPRALNLELLAYGYQQLRDYYPDEFSRYQEAVFVKYAQGTTAIEGNTVTPRQASELLEHNVTPSGKTLREIHELTNFRDLQKFLDGYKGDVSERLIKHMHAIIERNISEILGAYRQIQVWIEKADYVPPPPFELPTLMKELIEWYRKNKGRLHPFELGILLHTKFVTIHPFTNGNGRIGRALLNFVLQKNGYPALFLDLGNRERYLDAAAEVNDENYEPIINLLYDIYLSQHSKVKEAAIEKIHESHGKVFPEHNKLLKEFTKVTGKTTLEAEKQWTV